MKLHRVKTPTLKPAYIAALLPTGVAINYAGSLLRNMLGVPLFLDSGGTLLVTFIAGPWMGVVCAILQACMVALTLGPIHIVEFLPPSIIAIIVGYAARYGITQTWPGLIGTMIVIQPPPVWPAPLSILIPMAALPAAARTSCTPCSCRHPRVSLPPPLSANWSPASWTRRFSSSY